MDSSDYEQYLDFAKNLAEQAGQIMKKYFRNNADFKIKEDQTIVTITDEQINQMVIDRVNQTYPDHSIDGEEKSDIKLKSKLCWVCDPIDGTALFNADIPMSVFSLALTDDGQPVIGVVYDPWQDRLYTAIKGRGAFMNNQPMRVSEKILGSKNLADYDWWSDAQYNIGSAVYDLVRNHNLYFISIGSAVHACMLVAQGKMCVYLFPGTKGKNVDIAAAKVIVEEAGGRVTDLFGQEQRYDRDIRGAVVSNGIIHQDIVDLIKLKL